jgi:hypothetical protein
MEHLTLDYHVFTGGYSEVTGMANAEVLAV